MKNMHKQHLLFAMCVLGMIVSLLLYVQKQAGSSYGCWTDGSNPGACDDPRLQKAGAIFGFSTAAVGFWYYFALACAVYAASFDSAKFKAKIQYCIAGVALAGVPMALRLLYVQVAIGAFCPLCVLSSLNILCLGVIGFRNISSSEAPAGIASSEMAALNAIAIMGTIAMTASIAFVGISTQDRPEGGGGTMPVGRQGSEVAKTTLNPDIWVPRDRGFSGNRGGVSVLLFLDPNCAHCSKSFDMFIDLAAKLNGKAYFALQANPLWDKSLRQVAAIGIAARHGKDREMWRLQFARGETTEMSIASLRTSFNTVGIEVADLEIELKQAAVDVQKARSRLRAAGVRSTPAWFINGVRLDAYKTTPGEITRMIEELSKADSPTTASVK